MKEGSGAWREKTSGQGCTGASERASWGNALKFGADLAGPMRSTAGKHETTVIRALLLRNAQRAAIGSDRIGSSGSGCLKTRPSFKLPFGAESSVFASFGPSVAFQFPPVLQWNQ